MTLELPFLYGTVAYRMMLAHNLMCGFRKAWMPPDYKLEWVRVPRWVMLRMAFGMSSSWRSLPRPGR
jgi:hypothetical protein